MAQTFNLPLRLVCNTKTPGWFSCKLKKVDGLQIHRRHPHANRLDWHSCIRSMAADRDAKPLHGGAHQKSHNVLSATLTESKSYTNPDSNHSLATFEVSSDDKGARTDKLIVEIKEMFESMEDGEISPSAYDTAWVARVPAIDGSGQPQFPQTLEWILHNQLPDGSWGEPRRFLPSDRILNTLACLITLTLWSTGHVEVQRGLEFIKSHAESIRREALANHDFLKGFQTVFPAMLKEAKLLDLDLPDFKSSMKQINQKRDALFRKISVDHLHSVPTVMLYYLEGVEEVVDWEKILRMQSKDGSFLGSPASTACVYMHTGDNKCLKFLTGLLAKFEDHVPCMYPVDISERLRAVDTVERLGLERHFQTDIKQALDYVYGYWHERGLGFRRDSPVPDIDVTATGLRLLRMYGYDVSSDVLENIKADAEVLPNLCDDQDLGELLEKFSLYRCSEVNFPGENMKEIRTLTKNYLVKVLQNDDFSHALAVKENLRREIEYALVYPWNRNMPRLMSRNYIEHYSSNDLWLGKTLYHMPNVSDDKYLELAKLDFNSVQALHRSEIPEIQRWYKESGFPELTFTRHREVAIFWTASVVMPEPEYAACRLAYAKAGILAVILDDLYDSYASVHQANLFNEAVKRFPIPKLRLLNSIRWDPSLTDNLPEDMKICFLGLYNSLNDIGEQARQLQGRDVLPYLREAWWTLLLKYTKETEWAEAKHAPSLEEYWENAVVSIALGATTLTPMFCTGELLPEDLLHQLDFRADFLTLVGFTGRLINDVRTFKMELDRGELASCVQCYMNDHPGCTEEEALNYMYRVNEDALTKLNYEFLQHGKIPKCYRALLFNTARVMQLFYKNIDGFFNSETEMKEFMKMCLFEPVQ